jgi:hypothetical protein
MSKGHDNNCWCPTKLRPKEVVAQEEFFLKETVQKKAENYVKTYTENLFKYRISIWKEIYD